jgi:hypothetical protein
MSIRGVIDIWEGDKIGSDNKAFSALIWNRSAACLEAKPGRLIPGRGIIGHHARTGCVYKR